MGETQLNMAHLRYRPDVDGLRALAIASVVLYHSQIGVFGGGFVGVDVFFVISGYLITLLIHDPIRQGRFSFAEFWERRVRRIFPMLALVVAVTTVFALLILFPADLRRYSASAAAAVGFYSNFLFFSEAGYFDAAAAQKPLLHTWSLGAEAQFYLFFPPILYLLRRVETAKLLAVLGAIAAGSFALSQWAVSHAPAFAFYLFPPRMWELLVGGFLAIAAPKSNPGSALANGAAALGLSLIGLSVFGLSSETPFPGAAALPSCLGTALIIYSGACESSLINRILSLPPFTYLGRISYSLYLWHWPVLVLAGYYLFGGLTPAQKALAVGLSLALSAASWRLIEAPILRRKLLPSPRALMRVSGVFAALLVSASIGVSLARGLPQRYPAAIQEIMAGAEARPQPFVPCIDLSLDLVRAGRLCSMGNKGAGSPSFMLWGDSHAEALAPAIDAAAERKMSKGIYAARSSCPPFIGVDASRGTRCRDFAEATMKLALKDEVMTVIMAAYWMNYSEGDTYSGDGGHVFITEGNEAPSFTRNRELFRAALERTVKALTDAKIHVVLVGPVPEVGWPVPETLARLAVHSGETDIRPDRSQYLKRVAFVLESFAAMHDKYGVEVLRPDSILCASGKCEVIRDGHPLYRDTHHLSPYGAIQISALFDPVFPRPEVQLPPGAAVKAGLRQTP